MSRELDLHHHIQRIEDAGDDLAALYEAGAAGAIALAFRGTDARIGLTPVSPTLVREATERVLAALQRCAEAGRPEAWALMAEATAHESPEQALAWWEAAANAGHGPSLEPLLNGLWARRDREGLARVRPLLVREVEAGHGKGVEERYLGWLSFHGLGTPRDLQESRRWHEVAAAKGDADAMFELYTLYATGLGCDLDADLALQWCQRAAAAGSARAMSNLGGFYATGQGVTKDEREGVRWYERAAEAGSGRAASNLGVMAAIGQGMPVDREKAVRWFELAEQLGYPWWEMCEAAGIDPDEFSPAEEREELT